MRMTAVMLFVLSLAAPAMAQRQFGLGADLRLEGVVEPSKADENASLGTIKIRAGKVVRKFAVIVAQTAQTEGMSLFNRSELHPEQLLLYANATLLDVFRNAPAGTRLRMLGRYQGDDYILAEIAPVGGPGTTPGASAQPK
jgi:hypothetical protein